MGLGWFLWLGVAVVSAAMLISTVYFVAEFLDLDQDYVNPVDLCRRLNPYIRPNFLIHTTLAFHYLFRLSWPGLIITVPLVVIGFIRIQKNEYMLDPTAIYKSSHSHRMLYIGYLVSYMLSFGYSLYRMFLSLQEKDV